MSDVGEGIDGLPDLTVIVGEDGGLVAGGVGGGIAAGGPVRNCHVLLFVVLMLVDQPALGVVTEIIVGIVGIGNRGQGVLRGGSLAGDIAVTRGAKLVRVAEQMLARAVIGIRADLAGRVGDLGEQTASVGEGEVLAVGRGECVSKPLVYVAVMRLPLLS